MNTKKYLLIILALSLTTHFAFFGHPAETVFDEVHFGKFISGYFTGEYFFDIHPPLGKLMIAGMAKISGFQPGFSFETIGQDFPDDSYKWLRFLPKLAGSLLPVLVFLIALKLGISQKFAFLAGLLVIFDNALLTQSRFILLDSFLLLFGFLGILFYLKKKLFWAGIFAALAFSVKWTGFSFLAIIMILYFLQSLNIKPRGLILRLSKFTLLLIVIPLLIYFSIFAIHFSLLDKPGPGDAFHPPNFHQMNILEKFTELNTQLYASNARLTASHPYSSQWYEWPLMTRPIYYWNGPANSPQISEKIYLIGNPLIWWISIIAVIYTIAVNFFKFLFTKNKFLLFGFLTNWLPFIFIGRVMFLYHYLTALVFSILILCFQLDKLKSRVAFNTILVGSIILFLFFSPLTYGLAIPEWYYKLTVWLPSWR